MSEAFEEQMARMRMMANGGDKWDLSPNDRAALVAVLGRYAEMEAALHQISDGTFPDAEPGAASRMLLIAREALKR
jgi:hypothetical protein